MSPYVRTVKTALLKAATRQRLAAGRGRARSRLQPAAGAGPLPITSSRMGHLLDALARGYAVLGLEKDGSIRKFVRTARRYHTVEIQAGPTFSPPPTPSPTTSTRGLTKINNVG